jgi:hypothetical protein
VEFITNNQYLNKIILEDYLMTDNTATAAPAEANVNGAVPTKEQLLGTIKLLEGFFGAIKRAHVLGEDVIVVQAGLQWISGFHQNLTEQAKQLYPEVDPAPKVVEAEVVKP